jgi:hypothetical protein
MGQNRNQSALEPAPAAPLSQNALSVLLPEPLLEFDGIHDARPTVVFRSKHAGEGDPYLGSQLAAEYLEALYNHPEPPQTLLFYNSGIFLTLESSPVLELLRHLAKRGCEVLVCKTSLQALAPARQPAIGQVAPLAELIDRMRQAKCLLWP